MILSALLTERSFHVLQSQAFSIVWQLHVVDLRIAIDRLKEKPFMLLNTEPYGIISSKATDNSDMATFLSCKLDY